jgi:hypothetical protein
MLFWGEPRQAVGSAWSPGRGGTATAPRRRRAVHRRVLDHAIECQLEPSLRLQVRVAIRVSAINEPGSPRSGVRFRPVSPTTDEEMDELLGTIERRIQRLLAPARCRGLRRARSGSVVGGGARAGGACGRLGPRPCRARPRAGARVRRCGRSPELLSLSSSKRGPCHARQNGFDLRAGVVVPGRDRARLDSRARTLSVRRDP